MVLDKLKKLFDSIKCKFSCLSSCCMKTEADIHIDIDGDGKEDLEIKVKNGEVEIIGK